MLNLNNDKVIEKDLLELVYPVGSIYMSVNNVSPSSLFGGSWEQIEDTFLLAAGSTFTAGDTGGAVNHTPSGNLSNTSITPAGSLSSTSITPAGTLSGGAVGNHTLTVAQIPGHTHQFNRHSGTDDSNFSGHVANAVASNDTTPVQNAVTTTSTGGGGAHNHPFTQPTFKGTAASHSHTFTGTAASHGHTFTGTSQNTMPPYLTVYIWKRVS